MSDEEQDRRPRAKIYFSSKGAWDGVSMEDAVRLMLREGKDEEVIALIRSLPEASRAKYRKIWKEVKGKKS